MLSGNAIAAEQNIYLHAGGFSKHFDDKRANGLDYNSVHNNLGLEYERELDFIDIDGFYWSVTAQYLKNSVDNDSGLFVTGPRYRYQLNEDWAIGYSAQFGVQNGYPKASKGREKNDFVFVAYPLVELSYKRAGVYVTCVPEIYNSGFCLAGFKYKVLPFSY